VVEPEEEAELEEEVKRDPGDEDGGGGLDDGEAREPGEGGLGLERGCRGAAGKRRGSWRRQRAERNVEQRT